MMTPELHDVSSHQRVMTQSYKNTLTIYSTGHCPVLSNLFWQCLILTSIFILT